MHVVKEEGAEPIPGYKLVAPLGRGGYGEVWKCEAPGGLFKAIKFVYGNIAGLQADLAETELRAIERVKAIRHPFLLSLDRVECVNGELLVVMELADRNLHHLLAEYQKKGKPGIPRAELLGYLHEAAEVLDVLNFEHHLQHVDIKPNNLFLVSRHVKVADFGLVKRQSGGRTRHSTVVQLGAPLYASPEVFLGKLSPHSDQYSLAVVYQELLTGKLPFAGKNSRQLFLQHTRAEPDLKPLPPGDRAVVARALAKIPHERYGSCTEFVESLLGAIPQSQAGVDTIDSIELGTETDLVSAPTEAELQDVIRAILASAQAAEDTQQTPVMAPEGLNEGDGEFTISFRAAMTLRAARLKLDVFRMQWYGQEIRSAEDELVFQINLSSSFWRQWLGRQPALEVAIQFTDPTPLAPSVTDVKVRMKPLRCSKLRSLQLLQEIGAPLLDSLRTYLCAKQELRHDERIPWTQPLQVSTVSAEGALGAPITCRGKDISFSGIGFYLPLELPTARVRIRLPAPLLPPNVSLPALLIRAQRCGDGWYEIGAVFCLSTMAKALTPPPAR